MIYRTYEAGSMPGVPHFDFSPGRLHSYIYIEITHQLPYAFTRTEVPNMIKISQINLSFYNFLKKLYMIEPNLIDYKIKPIKLIIIKSYFKFS